MKKLSLVLLAAFLLLQVFVKHHFTSGPWCFPALTAIGSGGHPMYEEIAFGFPLAAVGWSTNTCAEPQTTEFEVSAIGIMINGVVVVGILYPFWKAKLNVKP